MEKDLKHGRDDELLSVTQLKKSSYAEIKNEMADFLLSCWKLSFTPMRKSALEFT